MNIWFSSDFHYNHKNIVKGTSEWEDKNSQRTRNFQTLEEHNETLIKNINLSVKPDDTLYFLGDWSFGGINSIWNFRKQLNCQNIHLIYGNHDQHIEANKLIEISKEDIDKYDVAYDPLLVKGGLYFVELQDIFSSVSYYKELKINGRHFVLCHFAMRVWNKSHKGSYHLYAHSHASLEDVPWGKSMDVGIDNYFRLNGIYRPFNINEIIDILDKRESLIVDHHNINTN